VNRPIRRVALAMLVLFGLLIANANYVQVFQGDKLRTDPGNTRVLLDEYERQRGTIVVDGRPVAESVPTDDKLTEPIAGRLIEVPEDVEQSETLRNPVVARPADSDDQESSQPGGATCPSAPRSAPRR